jgi:alpha-tubulin suppressor-like RCC1 family protein
VNTERPTSIRIPLLAIGIAIMFACSSDAHVGCSPTLTCSLRQARFAPTPAIDAGPQQCDLNLRRCAATQVSAGGQHSCAVTDADNLLCWGDNSQAQRGYTLDDPKDSHPTTYSDGIGPDASVYLSNFSRVLDGAKQVAAGGAHTCALLLDGSVKCWGRSAEGQVDGHSDQLTVATPVSVGISAATQIDAGALHSCAVVPAGVMCWGSGKYGQAGREQTESALAPDLVPNTQGAVEVACGVRHTCARLNTLEVMCWGELIDDSGAAYVTPIATLVSGLSGARSISAGAGHSCALSADFSAVCWGNNDSGQLGDGTTQASATPVTVLGLESGAGQVAAGGGELDGRLVGHSCAIDKSSQVACWGRDAEGQLGVGLGSDSPTRQVVLLARVSDSAEKPTLANIESIDLGAFHSCAVGSQGSVYCWGDDTAEQLGSNLGLPGGGPSDQPDTPGRASRVGRFGSMR